jgi:hypothetical protein
MVEAVPHTYKLDEYLKDVIQAVYGACSTAVSHINDESKTTTDNAIQDCEEILGVVMDGQVDEWID